MCWLILNVRLTFGRQVLAGTRGDLGFLYSLNCIAHLVGNLAKETVPKRALSLLPQEVFIKHSYYKQKGGDPSTEGGRGIYKSNLTNLVVPWSATVTPVGCIQVLEVEIWDDNGSSLRFVFGPRGVGTGSWRPNMNSLR